jgi:hypothetical protein
LRAAGRLVRVRGYRPLGRGANRQPAREPYRTQTSKGHASRRAAVRQEFKALGVNVGDRKLWCATQGLPYLEGDPDIVAYDRVYKRCIVAEVEGASSGQPEQKLYKAIGQIVRTASQLPEGWRCYLVVVVYGEKIATHLGRAKALEALNISALHLQDCPDPDRWLFGATWTNAVDDGEGATYLRQPEAFVWDERLTEEDKALVAKLNAALECLNGRRAIEINVAGPFARSKIAWKLAVHQQGLLHRLIALMDGTSVAWNNRRTLSAILSARAHGDYGRNVGFGRAGR